MSLKPIYDLESITEIEENHNLLVYQDKRLKKINAKDLFYSKEYVKNNIEVPKNDIIKALADLNVSVPNNNASLNELIGYVDNIDLFEIGVRRLVHDGTDTSEFSGTQSFTNNPKFVSMGNPQTSSILERCYKIGGLLTVIPTINVPNPDTDLIYAGMSTEQVISRNDFYGGEYASNKWQSGIYPWNEMEKVIDEHGNHFTKVPLYFIKEEYITDTGVDISESWPKIPKIFIGNNIHKYTFVCKTKLPGYRPAEFFYKYEPHTMIPDPNGEYIYLEDLNCYMIPTYYPSDEVRYYLKTDVTYTTYTKILTKNHYFACYEASTEIIDTYNNTIGIASKPGVLPVVSTTLSKFREYCNNTDGSYYIKDIRSTTDFFSTLFEIEFATTNSQSIATGVTDMYAGYNSGCKIVESATNTNTLKISADKIYPYSYKNNYISIGTSATSANIAKDRLVENVTEINDKTYSITFSGEPVTVTVDNSGTTKYYVWGTRLPTGTTDTSELRSTIVKVNELESTKSFKWNWIENPYGNTWKITDGIHIVHELDSDGLVENCIYASNNPKLYKNSNDDGYYRIKYILPSQISGETATGTVTGWISQMGYDHMYPWCQVPSKLGKSSSTNMYGDCLYDTSHRSSDGNRRSLIMGGAWYTGPASGMNCFAINFGESVSLERVGTVIEKNGE